MKVRYISVRARARPGPSTSGEGASPQSFDLEAPGVTAGTTRSVAGETGHRHRNPPTGGRPRARLAREQDGGGDAPLPAADRRHGLWSAQETFSRQGD